MLRSVNHRAIFPAQQLLLLLPYSYWKASLVVQWVKSLPAVQDSDVGSLAWEDPLEKEMATHSRIVAWKVSLTEEPGGL